MRVWDGGFLSPNVGRVSFSPPPSAHAPSHPHLSRSLNLLSLSVSHSLTVGRGTVVATVARDVVEAGAAFAHVIVQEERE